MRKEGLSVFIFPEGTRSYADGPEMGAFKKGAFHLAVKAGVPIVPVVAGNYWGVLSVREQRFRGGRIPVTGESVGRCRSTAYGFLPVHIRSAYARMTDPSHDSTTTDPNSPPQRRRRRRTNPDDAREDAKRARRVDRDSDGPESRKSTRPSRRGRSGKAGHTNRHGQWFGAVVLGGANEPMGTTKGEGEDKAGA